MLAPPLQEFLVQALLIPRQGKAGGAGVTRGGVDLAPRALPS
jgi:hypothetical protein